MRYFHSDLCNSSFNLQSVVNPWRMVSISLILQTVRSTFILFLQFQWIFNLCNSSFNLQSSINPWRMMLPLTSFSMISQTVRSSSNCVLTALLIVYLQFVGFRYVIQFYVIVQLWILICEINFKNLIYEVSNLYLPSWIRKWSLWICD